MWKSLILTPEEEIQRKIDFFSMPDREFEKKWHISWNTARNKYWNRKTRPKKEFTPEERIQAEMDYLSMPINFFTKKYRIWTDRARQIFWKKVRRFTRKNPLTEEEKEAHRKNNARKRDYIEEQYEKAMAMWNISRIELDQLLNEWWGFSEIFAGEKIDGKVIPKKLIYVQR